MHRCACCRRASRRRRNDRADSAPAPSARRPRRGWRARRRAAAPARAGGARRAGRHGSARLAWAATVAKRALGFAPWDMTTTTNTNTTTSTASSARWTCACARSRPCSAQKGYIDPAALDVLIDTYQTKIGPRNGARVVARAWSDPAFADWLRRDATAAIASLGYTGRQGEHMVAVENTAAEHHMVVCTLCSCYPWPVLGLPPTWYKSAPYRSRAVKDPRGVLADFGVTLPESTADPRVGLHRRGALPRHPAAPGRHRGPERRATRRAGDARLDDRHRPGRVPRQVPHELRHARRPGRPRGPRRRACPRPKAICSMPTGSRAPSPSRWPWAPPAPGTSTPAAARARRCPTTRELSYYQIWLAALQRLMQQRALLFERRSGRRPRACTRPPPWRAC